ncbi:hypothetical protein BL250_05925 [Erwinia sp. OLTSP20]|uniref:PilN domain-containing protein n=1 Tax=unclassified Erwinia TaxID=2622719 RepID=UPI000C17C0FA|nr:MULTISPECIES: PilN domain-containing protein [unclassified Erwinia]PIJ51201.1 hypothetical protein BV501_05385 [Erwinia sp. OAMSP11]PIJ73953.1 hypothetical protein BK416_05660 [Erwinia sp. OLSSP12]PIJ83961.1 hypothetical protein BLD47_03285 [Erwinia sp. OLCASP19]PIJ86491.1 hypothetical protein BLD46_03565 [Erwinia sp. OLMTSP26]PIJ87970.1 hypothetical protein BLD49_04245 [Erwinia sp. OLMDSP33]
MVWVNLLPWRERWLAAQRKHWLRMLLLPALLVSLSVVCAIAWQQDNVLQTRENQCWQLAQAQLKRAIERKTALQQAIHAAQEKLQYLERRNQRLKRWQKLVSVLDKAVPPGLWLAEIRGDNRKIAFTGHSSKVSDSGLFRTVLKQSGLFDQLLMTRLERADSGLFDFTLTADWTNKGRGDD